MRPSTARLLTVVSLAVVLALMMSGVDATVVTTCKAAADSDRRVDYNFCVTKLGTYRHSEDEDTRGLAKVAALVGILNAGNTIHDIKDLLARPGMDAKVRAALGQCQQLYDNMAFAFAKAHDDINNGNYPAGKFKAGEAASLARQCVDAFAKGAVPSPITQRGSDSVQIAIIYTAITNLIK